MAQPGRRKGRTRIDELNDYDGFVEKFKPKKTTDDCMTPQCVYDVVLKFARSKCYIPEGARIVRPFWPGGDYENFEYLPGDVVVDNPPFSILAKIRRFYNERGIKYFLFAPHLTLFSVASENDTYIVCDANVTYDNGARVGTSFVTNCFKGDVVVTVQGDFAEEIKQAQREFNKTNKPASLPKYQYPINVISSALLGKLAREGVEFNVKRKEAYFISMLDSQMLSKKSIFGGGFLISERAAAERAEAERVVAERAAVERWELSLREWEIIKSLSGE